MRQGAPFLSGLARILTRDGLCAGAADRVAFRVIAAPALPLFPTALQMPAQPLGRDRLCLADRPGRFFFLVMHAVPRDLTG